MIKLEKAISILEEYLHFEVNIDPLYNYQSGVSRIHYYETEYCWGLCQCDKSKVNSQKIEPNVGGGYIVDKEDGKIYMIGSSPFIDWQKEFSNFKRGLESEIKWEAQTNKYLNCVELEQYDFEYQEECIECHISERQIEIVKFVKTEVRKEEDRCLIFLKPFESEYGTVIFGTNLKAKSTQINIVSSSISDELSKSSTTLLQLKKYLRIKNYKHSDNYWIEARIFNTNDEFLDLRFEYKMEFFNK